VVATLRDYLTIEYRVKVGGGRVFTKDVIKGATPKVPQQNNFYDCGLFLLQYAESFFQVSWSTCALLKHCRCVTELPLGTFIHAGFIVECLHNEIFKLLIILAYHIHFAAE
jgi:Ulp1 family protease